MKKIILSALAFILGVCSSTMYWQPVYADATNTVILNVCGDKIDGTEKMKCLFESVVNIFSVIVGVIGVIGIVVFGIQYLTAGGSEEKVRKAKRRMFEVVIGMVIYVVMYVVLRWLGVLS